MSEPPYITDEQVAAAQLRLVLDEKLGRPTPEVVRRLAGRNFSGTTTGQQKPAQIDLPYSTAPERRSSMDYPPRQPNPMQAFVENLGSDWYTKAYKISDSDDPHALVALANFLHKRGHNSDAEAGYLRVLNTNPNMPEALLGLARLANSQEQLTEAEGWYRRAVDVNPSHVEALVGLANILNRQRRFEEAELLLRRAAQISD